MTKASTVLSWFFWIAFGAFLLASIPHVAWFFSVFEPHQFDGSLDWPYWLVSYALAVSIDVTVFLLSMTVAGLAKQKKSGGLIASVWAFIILLACLSWWINDKYAVHFQMSGALAASPLTINFLALGTLHIPDTNPLIASCFQVLAVAYTWISDKITSGAEVKTATQLEEEVKELERIAAAKVQMASIKRGRFASNLKGLIDAGTDVVNHIKEQTNSDDSQEETDLQSSDIAEESTQETVGQTLEDLEESNIIPMRKARGKREESTQENAQESSLSWLPTGQSTVDIHLVAKNTKLNTRLLRSRIGKGEIRRTKNADVVFVDSLISWMKTNGYLTDAIEESTQETVGQTSGSQQKAERHTDELTPVILEENVQENGG
jgi:hypothetical protein